MSESVETQCPGCGYLTLNMIAGRLVCGSQSCSYEHDVTGSIPIVRPEK
jgi:hypothetical protein